MHENCSAAVPSSPIQRLVMQVLGGGQSTNLCVQAIRSTPLARSMGDICAVCEFKNNSDKHPRSYTIYCT